MPLHYVTTLAGIKLTLNVLGRMGKLRSAKEVEYGVRTSYEKYAHVVRKLNERRLTAASHYKSQIPASFRRRKPSNKET